MSDLLRAIDIDRLLQLLIHDLRSPLGVAQGYVSLLGGEQLSTDDRARALRGVTEAIGRMSRLVDDVATLLLPNEVAGLQPPVETSLLCERVAAEAERRGFLVTATNTGAGTRVTVGASIDRLAEAIAIVLSPAGGELCFVACTETPRGDLEAMDPESVGTVELLKAHRHIALLDGRVWRKVGESRAYVVTLLSESTAK